jgi:hypothetical protein
LLTSFLPYGPTFNGGVQVAVADVDGDGLNDIITVPTLGAAEVKVFRNVLVGGVSTFDASNPYRDFLAFPSSFIGGGVVAGADMGSTATTNAPFNTTVFDQKAEIVVGSGAGITTTVKVFDVSHMPASTPNTVPAAVGSFTPFSTSGTNFKGGESVSVARVNADSLPDIVVGAGANGRSMVNVWAWSNSTSATLSSLSANGTGFAAFTDASRNAPVEVAAFDTNNDDIADAILAVQGPGGTTNQIRQFNIISASPLQVAPATSIPSSFLGPYYIATVENAAPLVTAVPPPALPGDYNLNGVVDSADYLVWRKAFGQTVPQFSSADGDGSSIVNNADYDVWRSHFGQTLPPGAGSEANSVAAFTEPVARVVKLDAPSTFTPGIPSGYDWNLFPLGGVARSMRDIRAPHRASNILPVIGRARGELLLAAMNVVTDRFKGKTLAEVASHNALLDQPDAPFGTIDLAFGLYNGDRQSNDLSGYINMK